MNTGSIHCELHTGGEICYLRFSYLCLRRGENEARGKIKRVMPPSTGKRDFTMVLCQSER